MALCFCESCGELLYGVSLFTGSVENGRLNIKRLRKKVIESGGEKKRAVYAENLLPAFDRSASQRFVSLQCRAAPALGRFPIAALALDLTSM
jgi:hypothetical protein